MKTSGKIEPEDPRLRLCVVTDDLRDGVSGLVARVSAAERGGASMVLLRLKHADARTQVEAGRALVGALRVPVVVSERLDVALACGAAGVHLRPGSMPIVAVRSQCPAGFLVAASVSHTGDVAAAVGADFVTIGPVADAGGTSLGVAGFSALRVACGVPAIAIGGIDGALAVELRAAGASGVAVLGRVLGSADPESAAREFAHA
jgi:thiamine-phosphate pyrophosphorylase